MNFSKNYLLLVLAIATLMMSSCKKNEAPCIAPEVAENIIGTWTRSYSEGTVEFKTGGVLIDAYNIAINGEIEGDVLDQKTYIATNDSLYMRAESATTTNYIDTAFPFDRNECNEVSIREFGVEIVFTRQ